MPRHREQPKPKTKTPIVQPHWWQMVSLADSNRIRAAYAKTLRWGTVEEVDASKILMAEFDQQWHRDVFSEASDRFWQEESQYNLSCSRPQAAVQEQNDDDDDDDNDNNDDDDNENNDDKNTPGSAAQTLLATELPATAPAPAEMPTHYDEAHELPASTATAQPQTFFTAPLKQRRSTFSLRSRGRKGVPSLEEQPPVPPLPSDEKIQGDEVQQVSSKHGRFTSMFGRKFGEFRAAVMV